MLKPSTASSLLARSRAHFSSVSTSPSTTSLPKIRIASDDSPPPLSTAPRATMASTEPPKPQSTEQAAPPRGAYFPLGYKDALYQWWTSVTPPMAERNVLNLVPHLQEYTDSPPETQNKTASSDPYGRRVWRSSMVKLRGKNRALNEYSVERVGEEADETLVMLHGYGAGLGFFYKNFEPLTREKGWKLFALDMLGMGNSARPPFKVHAKDQDGKIAEAENWFIDALEEWRIQRKIEKFTLLGHSLGGYLAVSYALKYPGRLNKLILASPVGIPENPYAVNEDLPEPTESTMASEVLDDQVSVTRNSSDRTSISSMSMKSIAAAAAAANRKSVNAPKRRPLPSWVVWLWDANVSPFSIVRLSGPLGPRFVSGWTSRRFNHLPDIESRTLHDYAFALFRQRGSGEYALPYLLAPGAYARSPMINRIHAVGRQMIPAEQTANGQPIRESGLPIVLMYGENDWMDVESGLAAEQRLKKEKRRVLLHGTDEEKRRERGSAKVVIVPSAGHHLYLDNPDYFNEAIRKELEQTRQEGLRDRS